ncbi:PilZ domain-containing protein [Aestuariibacter salexigens]|uniref:PilZ domain-containing protein n=1 Tax=Aestuariibacter salexigens TaxID=226010 RepID=UPI000409E61F|nr:PilZ domain-containing protein [Aestuariibacter salexigens]
MTDSSESDTLKQYQALINALIPYQQDNRLLEGLNKFSSRIPSKVRSIIKDEVIRLTSLTDASADNSQFAEFPVMKFKHFGIPMRLDKVGQEILKKETSRYLDRYTVGVFESVMNSEHYQSHIKREQQKKIVDAFSVEAQSIKDIDFAQDLAVRPNFSVLSIDFEKGKSCPVAALNFSGMVVETKRAPVVESDRMTLSFTFPDVPGLVSKGTQISFERGKSEFNKAMSRFETTFTFKSDAPNKLVQKWKHYIASVKHQFPLQRDLEIERVIQDLERDKVLATSPWIPVFIHSDNTSFTPLYALVTSANLSSNLGFETLQHLPGKRIFNRIMKELKQHNEAFLLRGTFQTKADPVTVVATHRELFSNQLLKQFISMAVKNESLSVMHCRLSFVKTADKDTAFAIHDMLASDNPELDAVSHVLFCRDISAWVGKLQVSEPDPFKPFSSAIIDNEARQPINIIVEADADRRAEPRYLMEKQAKVHAGVLASLPATLNDLSASGLKITLHSSEGFKRSGHVRVSVPELKLNRLKYSIVDYDERTRVLRLSVVRKQEDASRASFSRLFESDRTYFKQVDVTRKQRSIHRFLWDISIRYLPCAGIVVTKNRHVLDRLKTVYMQDESPDLQPFSRLGSQVLLDGFFADKDSSKPASQLLTNLLKKSQREAHIIHAVRGADKRIIFVKENDFLFGKVREQLSAYMNKKALSICVTQVTAIKCEDADTPLTQKRLAQLSKIDLESHEKLLTLQSAYTHIIYLSNVSSFHYALLLCGISPQKTSS